MRSTTDRRAQHIHLTRVGAQLAQRAGRIAANMEAPELSVLAAAKQALLVELLQRMVGRLAVDAGIGWFELRRFNGAGYPYASMGVSTGIGPLQAYLSFVTSRAEQRGVAPAPISGDHWVAGVMWGF